MLYTHTQKGTPPPGHQTNFSADGTDAANFSQLVAPAHDLVAPFVLVQHRGVGYTVNRQGLSTDSSPSKIDQPIYF